MTSPIQQYYVSLWKKQRKINNLGKRREFFNGDKVDMSMVKYYFSHNKQFTIQNPFNPFWRTLCHNQPVMESYYSIFIDEELNKAYGLCRQCGSDSELQNGSLFWDVYWRMKIDETPSSM